MVSARVQRKYFLLTLNAEDTTNLHQTARHNAEQAIAAAKERAAEFDKQAGRQPFNGSRAQSGEKEDVETGGEGGLTEQRKLAWLSAMILWLTLV